MCLHFCAALSPVAGIDASNMASIFEEHVVLPQLDPFQPINCSFGLKDKVFNFGPLIAQLPELAPEAGGGSAASPRDGAAGGAKKGARPAASAKAAAPRTSVTGPDGVPAAVAPKAAVVPQPDTGSLLDDPAAVKANLKFINPKKVPCTVNFSIQPHSGAVAGERDRT